VSGSASERQKRGEEGRKEGKKERSEEGDDVIGNR